MPQDPANPPAPLPSRIFEWTQFTAKPTPVGEVRPFFDSPTQTFRNLECHATTLNAFER
jgi:hypothetical protein